jgi:phosphatidylserine decarboxylase
LSVRQGQKFDNPKSRSQIIPFIKFHGLDCTEIRWKQPPPTPILSDYSNLSQRLIDCNFENFNEFFYRRLVDGARPVDSPADDCLISSPADCRVNLFENVDQATKLWIKGEKFAVSDLLQDAELNERLINAVVGVFRLAPQDYHRFHHPGKQLISRHICIKPSYS